jgi:hypothetical protein
MSLTRVWYVTAMFVPDPHMALAGSLARVSSTHVWCMLFVHCSTTYGVCWHYVPGHTYCACCCMYAADPCMVRHCHVCSRPTHGASPTHVWCMLFVRPRPTYGGRMPCMQTRTAIQDSPRPTQRTRPPLQLCTLVNSFTVKFGMD